MVEFNNSPEIDWQVNAKTDSNSIIRFGFWSIGIVMIVFMIWAMFFPLASAVITPGTLVSSGKNKVVQHSIGGRVLEILAVEGDALKEGQIIIKLDPTDAQAELTKLEVRQASLKALSERLNAERAGGLRRTVLPSGPTTPVVLRGSKPKAAKPNSGNFLNGLLRGSAGSTNLREHQDGAIQEIVFSVPGNWQKADNRALISSQQNAYESGQNLLNQEVKALEQKAKTLKKRKNGIVARMTAQEALLDMSQKEYDRLVPLARKGFVALKRLNTREASLLELEGNVVSLSLDAEGVDAQIKEIRIEIQKARLTNVDSASKEYSKVVGEIAEISDQLIAAQHAVRNTIVRAPVSGELVHLAPATIGGVIGAADPIGEIVPEGVPLVVQTRIAPGDIDYVGLGQEAEIVVTAFNRRIDDTLTGTVSYISGDIEQDEKTGNPFYTARLNIRGVSGVGSSRLGDLQAGMQAEVYIQTGSRTFIEYLLKPMVDSFRRAFKEQ